MKMDRAEKLGLGAAIGGHVILLGAMAFGLLMSSDRLKKPQPIAVSLVGEVAEVSTAPDAIQEESAPPAPGEAEPVEPQPDPPVMQIAKPVEKPQVTPVEKPIKRETPTTKKTIEKKAVVKKPTSKPVATSPKSSTGTAPAKTGGLSKSFEEAINKVGKAPGSGTAVGTPARLSAAEVKREVTTLLGPQIQRRVEACTPSGIEISRIVTTVSLSLDSSGRLLNVTYGGQTGITDSNRPQAEPLKQCILGAVRAASPYKGLDPEYHDVWKSHSMRLKPRG